MSQLSDQTGFRFSRRATAFYAFCGGMTFLASSSAPTPLYHLYQESFGLKPLDITIIFASYAFSLLAALLTVGSLSDYLGRKPLILAALLLNAVAMVVFITADSSGSLLAARVIQGFAAGIAMPTLGATAIDADPTLGPLLNSIYPFFGMFFGSMSAGLLVTFAPAPLQAVYLLLLAITALQILLLFIVPETTHKQPGALASLKPAIRIPPKAMSALIRTSPLNIAGWALGGFYLSLMPGLVSAAMGISTPLLGASVVSTLVLVAAVSVLLSRRIPTSTVMTLGTLSVIVGMAVSLIGIKAHMVSLLFLGTAIVGIGFGTNFSAILRIVLPLADPEDRAALLATFFVESYLAFSLPAIAAGLSVGMIGLTETAEVFGGIVMVMAVVSLVATRRLHRPTDA